LGRTETFRMSENARALSETKYRWEHMEPVLESLYLSILDSRKQGR
jgi:hypothetical protein